MKFIIEEKDIDIEDLVPGDIIVWYSNIDNVKGPYIYLGPPLLHNRGSKECARLMCINRKQDRLFAIVDGYDINKDYKAAKLRMINNE